MPIDLILQNPIFDKEANQYTYTDIPKKDTINYLKKYLINCFSEVFINNDMNNHDLTFLANYNGINIGEIIVCCLSNEINIDDFINEPQIDDFRFVNCSYLSEELLVSNYVNNKNCFFVIKELEILEPYRGNGLGRQILWMLSRKLQMAINQVYGNNFKVSFVLKNKKQPQMIESFFVDNGFIKNTKTDILYKI